MRLRPAILLAAALGWLQPAHACADAYQSFAASPGARARPVHTAAGVQLAYELNLTNFSEQPLVLQRLTARDAGSGAVLASFDAGQLAGRCLVVPFGRVNPPCAAVAPGRHALVYVDLELGTRVPPAIVHELDYRLPDGCTARLSRLAPMPVESGEAAVLDAPLEGGPWVAVHHPAWPRGHRRVPYATEGSVRLPGRYAIDFIKVGEDGALTRGDADRTAAALGYGAPVLAVAAATVAAVRVDMAESPTISGNPAHALGEGAGNFVSLRLDDGRYVFYEHLQPGSITVRVGERVQRRQRIGTLGFSGDSTGPHLHFHVADTPSPLGGDGLPFHFRQFRLLGHYPDVGVLGRRRWQPRPAGIAEARQGEWPGFNAVVDFSP